MPVPATAPCHRRDGAIAPRGHDQPIAGIGGGARLQQINQFPGLLRWVNAGPGDQHGDKELGFEARTDQGQVGIRIPLAGHGIEDQVSRPAVGQASHEQIGRRGT